MRGLQQYLWLCLVFLGLAPCALRADSSQPQCNPIPPIVSLDQVWGGTRVGFDSIEVNGYIYVGYFNKDRWLSVTSFNKCTGEINKKILPSRFNGWDAHNFIRIEPDNQGIIHMAGNMHASPLVYGRMATKDKVESLSLVQAMTGINEDKTTSPYFFHFPDGALGFAYRMGISGDGLEIINRFDKARWKRWLDQPLFSSASESQSVNAYHTGFQLGPDGYFHIAWVWRAHGGVESNFYVNYAKSKDLKVWRNTRGETLNLPITPANAEIVDNTGENSGLFNNIKIGFDGNGYPIISYLKFDKHGFSQLFHARKERSAWKVVKSTNWTYRWDPHGVGTIPSEITFTGVSIENGKLFETVSHPKTGSITLQYYPDSLLIESTSKGDSQTRKMQIAKRDVPPGAILNIQRVRKSEYLDPSKFLISWLSHPANNRDKPRECRPMGLPCDFVSELQLHSNTTSNTPTVKAY